jgi:murein DD-endopeptidase MepM/ murein hydrolase activator NlpD
VAAQRRSRRSLRAPGDVVPRRDRSAGTAGLRRRRGGGRVVFAGFDRGGYGKLVEVAHGGGVVSLYAHLSAIGVRVGRRVGTGAIVGRVGSSGESTGPHLHFEVRVRGAAVDPVPALP